MAGYHINHIEKGVYGEASKIAEEFHEFMDARQQGAKVMELVELSDMLGAIEEYIKKYNMTLYDLIVFSDITKQAFLTKGRS